MNVPRQVPDVGTNSKYEFISGIRFDLETHLTI